MLQRNAVYFPTEQCIFCTETSTRSTTARAAQTQKRKFRGQSLTAGCPGTKALLPANANCSCVLSSTSVARLLAPFKNYHHSNTKCQPLSENLSKFSKFSGRRHWVEKKLGVVHYVSKCLSCRETSREPTPVIHFSTSHTSTFYLETSTRSTMRRAAEMQKAQVWGPVPRCLIGRPLGTWSRWSIMWLRSWWVFTCPRISFALR